MLVPLLLFLAGLILLVKGADLFVDGGKDIAARYGLSCSAIGFTIIAFGTSLPELTVTLNAVAVGNSDVGLGNVLGSNIANLGLILALVAILKPGLMGDRFAGGAFVHETRYMLIATAIYALFALRGSMDIVSGIAFLLVFAFLVRSMGRNSRQACGPVNTSALRDWSLIGGGLIGVIVGSTLLLRGAVDLAYALAIPPYVIGLSMVAVGTSIPELATSVVAILKGEAGISIGNLLGSNIFNLLFILGCSAFVAPIPILGMRDTILVVVFSVATIPLFVFPPRFTRFWAIMVFLGYCAYLAAIFTFY